MTVPDGPRILVGPSETDEARERGVDHFLQLAIPSRTARRAEHRERWRVRMRSTLSGASKEIDAVKRKRIDGEAAAL